MTTILQLAAITLKGFREFLRSRVKFRCQNDVRNSVDLRTFTKNEQAEECNSGWDRFIVLAVW